VIKLEFNSLKDLENYVNGIAKKAMNEGTSVKDVVIETGKSHVQTDVYNVYTPKLYERTGGLLNDWQANETADGMEIVNTRYDLETGKNIAYTVITGIGYDYPFPYAGVPRPFIFETIKELERRQTELTNALAKDLKSIGIDVG
jgi:hypothetical protein